MAGLDSLGIRSAIWVFGMLALPFQGWSQVSLRPDTTALQWGERVQLTANWL